MTPYARKVDLQLAWNRARPAMVSAGSRRVNYDADPEFANWLSGYNRKWRLGFEHRYLPFFHEQRSGQGLRLSELAPMPEDILHACFKSCRWEPRSSAGGRQSGVMAHLVVMTCQRLLAYHSARNAVYGQYHVVRLLRLLRTRRGRPEFTWEPATFFDSVVDGPLVVESGKPEVWLQRFVPETRKVIEKAIIAMATPETAWPRLKRLLPNRLFVQHACCHCRAKEGTRVQAEEAQLPPFGPRCCCRIEWRSSRRRELQRRVELWAFEVALSPNEPAPFPVGDFLRLGA